MTSKKFNNSNEKSELKTFMANMRSGSLVKLIESKQIQFEEKSNYITKKLKKFEEEMETKMSILQQNSLLIEKFQNNLQELSDQNTQLLEQQHILKEENENLHAQLKCSEDKFAQLDIVYDQKITDLSERNNELTQQLTEIENSERQRFDQFDQTQTDLNAMLTNAEQRIVDLTNELNDLKVQKKTETDEFNDELSELRDVLNQKTIDYEERIQDLQTRLSAALDANKEINELKAELEDMKEERKDDQKAFNVEKSRLLRGNEDLKVTVEDVKSRLVVKDKIIDDLKRKLLTKEKEGEELYLKFKQITRTTKRTSGSLNASGLTQLRKYSNGKNPSPDDPKPLEDSSDSDSSVSCYRPQKRRLETNGDDLFDNLKDEQEHQFRVPTFGFGFKKAKPLDIEIPESPIVSSSAFGNNDKK
ncbi:putative leucine-rich repeat-containing protein DDB_G0290503 [Episyrphus balteatus]|uniref:putative leucine-rich repeat-containing protein DDB_G0290503 n=1 Tax=Episyrphus balteatus TaxID=286459 RepID=UPI0024858DF1|nr:putative leucine-rich repeat-containing protein DDB_G0290503 [Episyrphus balteatus]